MAYATTNPPRLAVPAVGADSPNIWMYVSDDAATVVRAADYITNALDLGMKVNDIVIQSGAVAHIYVVITVDADGADLSDGTAIVVTNT